MPGRWSGLILGFELIGPPRDYEAFFVALSFQGAPMKRLIEWLNLVAALIRLADLISRTGWF